MNALRKVLSPKNGLLSIRIPKKYTQKQFEVIAIPIEDQSEKMLIKAKMNAFIRTLPLNEPIIAESDIFNEIKLVRQTRHAKTQD